MKIGFVYDLRDDYRAVGMSEEQLAEFDTTETVDRIHEGLEAAGCSVDRIGHGRALAARLAGGERWDLIFSIAEGVEGRAREAQVPALCELFDHPYVFSDTTTMAVTLDKSMAKSLVREAGVPTAPFMVLEHGSDAKRVDLDFPLFAKPIAEGTGKGCEETSRVHSHSELERAASDLIGRFRQPVIVEPYLSGREFTVGIVGTGDSARVVGTIEIFVQVGRGHAIYSLESKEKCEQFVNYRVADDDEAREAESRALKAYRALQCRDAARLDFRSDKFGSPLFLEVNPLPGLHPTHSDLPIAASLHGHSYNWLIASILASAAARYDLERMEARRSTLIHAA